MAFNWEEYLELAKLLAQQDDEAAQRSAISRAYYFVYHLARDRAAANGLYPGSRETHKETWDFFLNSPDNDCKKLGLIGQRLRDDRNKADYDLIFGGRIMDKVSDCISKATDFKSNLVRLNGRHPNVQSQPRNR